MNAIISNGDYTALVQLPVDRKQLAGALSYLGIRLCIDKLRNLCYNC